MEQPGNSELIAIGGTPEQKEQWLGPLLRGEITSSFSLTEPQYSGSDPTMIATEASHQSGAACASACAVRPRSIFQRM